MTDLLLIGDIHGKWQSYAKLLTDNPADRSIQLGDFGWGFEPNDSDRAQKVEKAMNEIPGDHKYFRGNHDCPAECANHEFCLDDLHWEPDHGLMVIAGANSIDRDWRTPGFDWWPEEELSYDQLMEAIDLYEQRRPRIVLSHECPEDIVPYMFSWYRKEYPSRTREALGNMLSLHQPDIWFFGHWHQTQIFHQNNTKFVCLGELDSMMIDI